MPQSHDHLTPPDLSSIPSDGGRHFLLPRRLTAALGAAAILLVGGERAVDTGYHIRETRDQITAHQTVKAGHDPFAWIGAAIGTVLEPNQSPAHNVPTLPEHYAPAPHPGQ